MRITGAKALRRRVKGENKSDIPIGLVREGLHKGKVMAGQRQWPVIDDIRNRRCDYWTGHNRRMRLVD